MAEPCPSGKPTCFSFTDAQRTESALNWWNCYNIDNRNPGNGKIAWIPAIAAVKETRAADKIKSHDGVTVPYWGTIERLMKMVPYGRADGMISSSFPSIAEMYGFLMRSIGIEEANIQNGLVDRFDSGGYDSKTLNYRMSKSAYNATKVVKNEVYRIDQLFLQYLQRNGIDATVRLFNAFQQNKRLDALLATLEGRSIVNANSGTTVIATGPKIGFGNPSNANKPKNDPLVEILGATAVFVTISALSSKG